MTKADTSSDQLVASTLRGLIMDATRAANSGHPGGAMSSADFASVLYAEFLRFDPDRPDWPNRDRFVLSAGHESALLYGLLRLAGFLKTEDLRAFRQLGSRTPGHPEVGVTPGVEATTGPLGQGFAMAVGMAVAECFLRARLGRSVASHFTYVLASDGDMQEPVSFGAASLAGLWGLGKLIVYYDANAVQLSGPVARADGADYAKIYAALGWHVLQVDGQDRQGIRQALAKAQAQKKKPSLIIGHSVMASGTATREGDFTTHGSPLPPEEIAATKKKLGLDPDASFQVPAGAEEAFRARYPELRRVAAEWREGLERRLSQADPEFLAFWKVMNTPRSGLALPRPKFDPAKKIATRAAWGECLNLLKDALPNLMGGSADLDPSNKTAAFREAVGVFGAENPLGRNLAFGVREFPMAAILNGMALHGGVIPFGATFLTFSDYCRNAIRMSALQKLPVLYVFTHDSFHVGEDGPTHQPIEHVASLRLIPNLLDFRPADAGETALCIEAALRQADRPSCLFLTRQGLPVLDPAEFPVMAEGVARGGYVLKDCAGVPDLILMASGSEVSLILDAAKILADEDPSRRIRIVSMPSMALFAAQPQGYRDAVLPPAVRRRAAVEAGRIEGWWRYLGLDGLAIGIDHFGASAPASRLVEEYGFTAPKVAAKIRGRFFG